MKNIKRTVFLNLRKIYLNPLFILTIITVGITIYLLKVQIRIGVPYWDVFNYLNNATYFAGMGISDVLSLPPLIPFLTSLFFRLGYLSFNTIFILDGIIFIIGVIGLYLLLKQRFDPIQSLTGSLIFISFPIIMSWAVTGGIDIPGVSLSIWAVYFTVVGVKRNPRFLYLVLPLTMLAFFTKYTAILILIPIFLYLFMNKKYVINKKKFILSVLVEIALFISIYIYFYFKLGAMSIYNIFISISSSTYTGVGDVAYNNNVLYYLQNTLNYISVSPFQGTYQQILNPSQGTPSILSYIITLIVLSGLILYIYRILNTEIRIIDKLKINNTKIIKVVLLLLLIIGLIVTFNNTSYIITEIIMFGVFYLLYSFLVEIKNIDLDLMFLSWFGAYLIFQSTLPIKVDRYFITMTPALVYFIILGLREFIDKLELKNKNLKTWGVYLIIALLLLSSAIATNIGHTPKKSFTVQIGSLSNWLVEYDPDYKDKIIYSDYPPAATWYLKKIVYGGFPRLYKSPDEFSKMLGAKRANYYIDSISKYHPQLKGYHIIKTEGVVAIYQKD